MSHLVSSPKGHIEISKCQFSKQINNEMNFNVKMLLDMNSFKCTE